METITAIAPFFAVGSSIISAVGSIRQGQATQDNYNAQADQQQVQANERSLEYQRRANRSLDESITNMARINARSGSANLDPFSGSIGRLSSYALDQGYADYNTYNRSSDITQASGQYQAGILRQAGKTARRTGIYEAIGTFGNTAMGFADIG